MTKAEFAKLSHDQQKIVKEVGAKYCRQIVEQTRKDNEAAMGSLQKLGLQKVAIVEADKAELEKIAKEVAQGLVGTLLSQDLVSMVQGS